MACRQCRATTCAHHDSLSWPCWMVGCQQWSCGAQHPRSTSVKAIVIVLGVVQKSCEIHASGHDRSFFYDFSLKIICCTARQHANERSSRSCCTTVPTSFNPRRCDCGSLRRRSPDLQCITQLHSVTNWTISCNQHWHLFHIHVRTKLSLDGCTKHKYCMFKNRDRKYFMDQTNNNSTWTKCVDNMRQNMVLCPGNCVYVVKW